MTTTVLIADDQPNLREGVRIVLESEPDFLVVGEACDGREAVRLVGELRPDVVVMDVAMPELTGIEATREILARELPTRVLALSMHSDRVYVKGMLQAGARGYLLKDCAAEELPAAIRAVCADERFLSAELEERLGDITEF